MTMFVGGAPGTQYSGDDLLKGKCPRVGTVLRANDANGTKEYLFCLVAAAQNLIDGHLVTIDPTTFTVTIAAAGNPSAPNMTPLGVARTLVTASASAYIWVQRYGVGSVQASASTLPNIRLSMSAAAGAVDDAVTSVSGALTGIVLTATTGATGITACFLDYPHFDPPSHILT